MLTDDELKRIAIQCGLDYSYTKASLRKFANAIRADEREACARVCDELAAFFGDDPDEELHPLHKREKYSYQDCAAAIRARKEKE